MFLAPAAAHASSLDLLLSDVWNGVSASKNFHTLDNAGLLTFKDLGSHTWYSGLSTTVYSYSYLDIDFLAVKSMDITNTYLPGGGAALQAGKLLYDKVPPVKTAADAVGKAAPIISGGNFGVGYFRKFAISKGIWGFYGQLFSKFGPGGK